jgi:hypothetical protein
MLQSSLKNQPKIHDRLRRYNPETGKTIADVMTAASPVTSS